MASKSQVMSSDIAFDARRILLLISSSGSSNSLTRIGFSAERLKHY